MVGLTQKQNEVNKAEIIELLNSTGREGIDKLVNYLEKHDYFTAPASTQYHLAVHGGLAQHSLHVYYNMMELYYGNDWRELSSSSLGCKGSPYTSRPDEVDHENIIIVALLHDFCKVDFYKSGTRNVKENGAWKEVQVYTIDEQIPILGHGTKSVVMAQQFIRLYVPEIQAISFHMGMNDSDNVFMKTASNVYETCRLALYAHLADCRATYEQDVDCLNPETTKGFPF